MLNINQPIMMEYTKWLLIRVQTLSNQKNAQFPNAFHPMITENIPWLLECSPAIFMKAAPAKRPVSGEEDPCVWSDVLELCGKAFEAQV